MLDELDCRLVNALQVDGRAPVARLAEVLEVSARTVTRRLNRLTGSGQLHVVRVPDIDDYPDDSMLLRIRVLRGRVNPIADALARRPDVPFVDIALGGEEIVAVAVGDPALRDRLLVEELPATTAITATTAYAVLHVYADATAWRANVLTVAEVQALTPPPPTAPPEPLTELDTRLLGALSADARQPVTRLCELTDAPESSVRRRLALLTATGRLRTHATINPALLGHHVDANLWLQVRPAALDHVGRTLARHPWVHGVVATSGPSTLSVAVFCPTRADLHRFHTGPLAELDVTAAETTVVGRAVKRAGARLA
ncbi:DNA-binding Lrp family transcriptional regulator [Crossiella equi]|uniref:DNA-binding Lrp family transcriptional regulator n=1 Tax=Crossiella equi TaxID=130796 RepID=A0ABS5A4Z3_9PSEU|nr:DNA-binding Lrp family transcriptional regulator [Crossiella equi]